MAYEMAADGEQRLHGFFDQIGRVLRNARERESFAMYALGLLSQAERKSMEPIAAQTAASPAHAGAEHQRIHHFISNVPWSDHETRLAAARYAIAELEKHEPVTTWIIDDTGFLKQGRHSVGVQRQYTGSAGKNANCQVAVSLRVATSRAHLPIDFALFLPESWTADPERRKKARIPESATFKTKHVLALELIEQAARDEIPGSVILADCFYGHSRPFREAVSLLGFDYGMAIFVSDKMWLLDRRGRRRGELRSGRDIAHDLGRMAFRRCTWRAGTSRQLSSHFALVRVKVPCEKELEPVAEWLLIEWPKGEEHPTNCYLTTLPRRMSKKAIVRIIKERYRTEQAYEELKGELGLDHFEGRSYPGWHHHVSAVLCAYAFVVAERARAFSPSTTGSRPTRPVPGAP